MSRFVRVTEAIEPAWDQNTGRYERARQLVVNLDRIEALWVESGGAGVRVGDYVYHVDRVSAKVLLTAMGADDGD